MRLRVGRLKASRLRGDPIGAGAKVSFPLLTFSQRAERRRGRGVVGLAGGREEDE